MLTRRQRTDPRTIAREIPGLFDVLFPQLVPGVVAYLNRQIIPLWGLHSLPNKILEQSTLAPALLFEAAYVRAEQLWAENDGDLDDCIKLAVNRQSKYFDAKAPQQVTSTDFDVIKWVGENLFSALKRIEERVEDQLYLSPTIPGYGWIATGKGDYAISNILIEAKCTAKRFSAADYRQVLIYWLLSYAAAIEGRTIEWKSFILLNPRLCLCVELKFDDLIGLIAADRSKIEILELFNSLVGDYLKIDNS